MSRQFESHQPSSEYSIGWREKTTAAVASFAVAAGLVGVVKTGDVEAAPLKGTITAGEVVALVDGQMALIINQLVSIDKMGSSAVKIRKTDEDVRYKALKGSPGSYTVFSARSTRRDANDEVLPQTSSIFINADKPNGTGADFKFTMSYIPGGYRLINQAPGEPIHRVIVSGPNCKIDGQITDPAKCLERLEGYTSHLSELINILPRVDSTPA